MKKSLTVVYRGITPGEESSEIILNPKAKAMSWGEVIQQKNIAIDALNEILDITSSLEINSIISDALKRIDDLNGD